jgi:hypothetical protein
MTSYLGIDIAKAKIDVCLLLPSGQQRGSFANHEQGFAQLSRWLERHGVSDLHACQEATGRYGRALAHYLQAQGDTVSVVNPQRIAAYGRSKLLRRKSDRVDAQLIADSVAANSPLLGWRTLSKPKHAKPSAVTLRPSSRTVSANATGWRQASPRRTSAKPSKTISIFCNARLSNSNKNSPRPPRPMRRVVTSSIC